MDIFEQKLSDIEVGTPVRLTQINGQIIEGIVAENDKSNALSVTITANVTLRYSQIAGIEQNNALGISGQAVIPTTAAVPVSVQSGEEKQISEPDKKDKKPKVKVQNPDADMKLAFKAMNNDVKKRLNAVKSKIDSALKNHDSAKIHEAIDTCWSAMQSYGYEENPDVNRYYAYVCILGEEYKDSAISFYYANDIKNAYRAAYEGASKNDDTELYTLSAAYASVFLADPDSEYIDESVDVLMYSSEKCNDITGLEYVVSKKLSSDIKKLLDNVFIYLAEKFGCSLKNPSDHEKCIEAIRVYYQNKKVIEDIRRCEPEEEVPPESSAKPAELVPEILDGKITNYKFLKESGTITENSGKVFTFYVDDISDSILKSMLKSVSKWDNDRPIPVRFIVKRKMNEDCAVDIIRIYETAKPTVEKTEIPVNTLKEIPVNPPKEIPLIPAKDPNFIFSQGEYDDALSVFKQWLETPQWESAFSGIIMCYVALWNKNGDFGYSTELESFVTKYKDKISKTTKNLEALQQYYMKIQDYSDCLEVLNDLIEVCDSANYGRILHYLMSKGKCYRNLHDYPSAISHLTDWLEIVRKNRLVERYKTRESMVYPELAELYFEIGDLKNAEKYALETIGSDDRRNIVLRKIGELENPQVEPEEELLDENDEDMDNDTTSITLQEAYASYSDDADIDKFIPSDSDIIEKISIFDEKQLYSLVTWLTVASKLSKKSNNTQKSEIDPSLSTGQAIQSINAAFGYAYQHPLAECEYISTQVLSLYENSGRIIPQYNEGLMIAAFLRTLFAPSSAQDYYLEDLIVLAEASEISKKFPMLVNLLTAMKSFYESTGCAIDSFAGYRSNANVIDDIIAEAKELCTALDQRNEAFESQGQVRRLREFMFSDEQSELRKCLDIAADNKTSEFAYVKGIMQRLFIRKDRPITVDNIDQFKMDDYIDSYWDKARDVILSEGRHISRPHDKIKGSKRNNVVNSIKKIIGCVSDWLSVAEHAGNQDDAYIKQNYEAVAPQIIPMLEELLAASKHELKENGFNWGIDSIRYTTNELLSKMNGSYNAKSRKYFFIGFLSGEDVLLNDDYLPELQSTFCGWGRMSLLSRIERHATEQHVSFESRIAEILSDAETKHNFRTASLIKAYAEDTGNNALAELKEFEQLNACLKLAKKRFETMYEEFSTEISLYESYGTISDINGEKTAILKLALDWFRITRITADYGFYSRMLDYIKQHISNNAAERGQQLMRQLEELADKPEYDFGVYTKEMISGLINDQNFTSAEFILNCIRRHDTKEVHDYSIEPFGYFNEFVSEHATNYRAVFGAGKNIVDTIAEYSRKKDMEKALIYLTNNARKETKGGADILKSWLPKGGPAKPDNLQTLLKKLGFNPKSITPEDGSSVESYKVYCHKRCGKITYPHTIPAFGSLTETEGFRVMCLYGKFDCNSLMNKFRTVNTTAKHTLVLLDYALNMEERRRLARKIKEEKSFSKTFIVIDRVILFYLAKHYAPDDTIVKRFMAVTLPFAYYQPFVEKSSDTMPPELFTGREAELTSIESPEGVNLVYGGRQLGKSALLKMARHNIDKNGNNDRAILLDIQYKNYKEAATLVSRELIVNSILPEGSECDDWDILAAHIKKRLMDDDPETRINYLLIMLDEADEFIRTSSEDDNPPIAAVKNLPAGRFKLVMAGLHNLSRFNREMLQGNSNLIHLSSVVIKQFQRPEAIKLLTNTLAYLGFRFNENVISLILAKTNYYPGLIQFYCQKLLEAMKEEDYAGYTESNTPYYEVNEGHIKKVLSDPAFMSKVNEKLEASLFTEEKGHSHYHIIALIFAYLYNDASTEKKYTIDDLLRIAQDFSITRLLNLGREKIEELLNEMWDLNVLSKEDEYYRFATEGFRELLGSNDQVEDAILEYSKEGQA